MLHLILNLPKHRLTVQITKRRILGRAPFFPNLDTFKNIRSGSKISRFVRHFVERINFKAVLGRNLTLMVLTTSILAPAGNSFITSASDPEITVLPTQAIPLSTEIKFRYPLDSIKINQRFSYFHSGVDFDGEIGDPVYPITKGTVELREFGRFGYGNTLVIDHGNGIKSRYAHLSRIDVRETDDVDPSTPVGRVGSTGHSTGPHLHFEVYQNGRVVNPLTFLGYVTR